METLIVSKIEEYSAFGIDETGLEVSLTKFHRIPDLKIGDRITGNYLNDDENPDLFHFEVSNKI